MSETETESRIVDTKLIYTTSKGTRLKASVRMEYRDGRIFFRKSPFGMKDEIKAMGGARWHGFDPVEPKKMWSVDDSFRNQFQIHYMMGENTYEWFEQPIVEQTYSRPLMEHQEDLTNRGLTYHFQIWAAEMGTGKGGIHTTRVATPSGWTTLGEIQVGDEVINPNGGRTKVKGVYPRGKMEMFRVTFTDDSSVICSGDHLWNVRTAVQKWRGHPYKTLELNEIVDSGLQFKNGNNKHYIPMVTPVEYTEQPLGMDPYLMGYILGNGCLSQPYDCDNNLTIPDTETVSRLDRMMETPLKLVNDGRFQHYSIKDDAVHKCIRETSLKGHYSYDKWIPDEFMFNTVENRVALLQGLCDSDGHANHTGGVEYTTTSPELARDFVALVQSLGGTCHTQEKIPTYIYKGEKLEGKLAYIIIASFHSSIQPFKLSRKLNDYVVPTKYEPTRAITTVESIGEDECICIAVESENQLYVTDEFIVTHNTLAAQELIERSNVSHWYWVGPKPSLPNIRREFRKWGFDETCATIEWMTFEGLVRLMDEYREGNPLPGGVIFDESSRLKTATSQRSLAALKLTHLIRQKNMWDGFVILMSGTPSPKRPTDWWSQCEIAWPGFLREGSVKALEKRLAFQQEMSLDSVGIISKTFGWRDDEAKCDTCGLLFDDGHHIQDELFEDNEYHPFKPSFNEVAHMFKRLDGLVVVKHLKDCIQLPEKRYRRVECKPSKSLLRVAKTLLDAAPSVMVGMTLTRELSDGFQYRDVDDGTKPCNHCPDSKGKVEEWFNPSDDNRAYQDISLLRDELVAKLEKRIIDCPKCNGTGQMKKTKRITREVPCPKEKALRSLLDECEETGRIVVFAGFTGSVDRCKGICHKEGWAVVRLDGRGYEVTLEDGTLAQEVDPLDFWADIDRYPRVAFVAHPESGGMSLTLVESRMIVYWSNSFKPEYRVQSEARVHRKGMDENLGCTIVDLIHLPTDERVIEIIMDNRKLELMTMGEVSDGITWEDGEGSDE